LFDESRIAEVQPHDAAVRAPYWEPSVRALLAADRHDDAAQLLGDADRVVAALDLPLPRAHARRARAQLLLSAGEPARAAELARLAAADADAPGAVVQAAAARALAGRALAAAGDLDAAVTELRRGHRAFAACGADGRRDAAAGDLRRLGRRVARPRGTLRGARLGSLSAREQEVARLVAEGLTNEQIARELHITVKTVEMHRTHSHEKLGIGRRAALARMLADATSRS
jgi:DNA-binding NarL/FixJ family response regulator